MARRGGGRVPPRARPVDRSPARERLRDRAARRASSARVGRAPPLLRLRDAGVGPAMACRGDLGGAQAMSAPPAAPLLLASRSPQRRAILEQLGIPFDVVPPRYEEDVVGGDPVETVRKHAR